MTRSLALVLVVSLPAWAQPLAPGYWSSGLLGGGCSVCAHDADGNLLVNIPYGSPFTTLKLAKHPDGSVWGADFSAGKIVRFVTPGSVDTEVSTGTVHHIAVDVVGRIWTSHGGLWGAPTVVRRDALGTPIGTYALPGGYWIEDMMVDPLGNLWVSSGTMGLYKVEPTGAVAGPLFPAQAGTLLQFAVDQDSHVWTLVQGAATRFLVHHDNDMQALRTGAIPDAVSFALDWNGNPRVLLDSGLSQVLGYHDRLIGLQSTVSVSSSGGDFQYLAVDTRGNTWLTGANLGIKVLSCDGIERAAIGGSPGSAHFGDRTGLHRVAFLERSADTDLDGVFNLEEFFLAADAADATSPPPLVPVGPPRIGTAFDMVLMTNVTAPPSPWTYVVGCSLGNVTGFPLGPFCANVPIDLDDFLLFWLDPVLNVFALDVVGLLDPLGNGTTTVIIPDEPGLIGLSLHFSGLTVDSNGLLADVTQDVEIVITS